MKRTKEWWNMLSERERSLLVHYERFLNKPKTSEECPFCGTVTANNVCDSCQKYFRDLINRTNKKIEKEAYYEMDR